MGQVDPDSEDRLVDLISPVGYLESVSKLAITEFQLITDSTRSARVSVLLLRQRSIFHVF